MRAHLITFKSSAENPKRGWPLSSLQELVRKNAAGRPAVEPWRFHGFRQANIGDRVFLLRQGTGGPAIIGYGAVDGLAFNRDKRWFVPVRFEVIVDPTERVLVDTDKLRSIPGDKNAWRAQASGISLSPSVADCLERLVNSRDEAATADKAENSDPAWFSVGDYIDALRNLQPSLSVKQIAMLVAHAEAPGGLLSAMQLAQAGGGNSFKFTNSVYGRLGVLFGEWLEPRPSSDDAPAVWTRYIGDDERLTGSGELVWHMHPELVEALHRIGWASKSAHHPLLDLELAKEELSKESPTAREALVQSRIGQGPFRSSLLDYWGRCAVTGLRTPEVLRASHIKPWKIASNAERLDPFNGLLLVGNLDLLFDAGLISFENSRQIMISDRLSDSERTALGLVEAMRLERVEVRHLAYLAYHRDHVFR